MPSPLTQVVMLFNKISRGDLSEVIDTQRADDIASGSQVAVSEINALAHTGVVVAEKAGRNMLWKRLFLLEWRNMFFLLTKKPFEDRSDNTFVGVFRERKRSSSF